MRIANICLSTLLCAGLTVTFVSCSASAPKPVSVAEKPASEGQRQRFLSELHGSRKLLSDALAAKPKTTKTAAVEGLIQAETKLLELLKNAKLEDQEAPRETGLTGDAAKKAVEDSEKETDEQVAACLTKWDVTGGAGSEAKETGPLGESFRKERDATLAFVRESQFSFFRRTIKHPTCGSMSLATSLMLQAEATTKLSEVVNAAP